MAKKKVRQVVQKLRKEVERLEKKLNRDKGLFTRDIKAKEGKALLKKTADTPLDYEELEYIFRRDGRTIRKWYQVCGFVRKTNKKNSSYDIDKPKKEVRELREEAQRLERYFGRESGFLKSDIRTKKGASFLKKLSKTPLTYKELEYILQVNMRSVREWFKLLDLAHQKQEQYSEAQQAIIKEYYERSHKIQTDNESVRLRNAMVEAVNEQRAKEGEEPVSINAIRCVRIRLFPKLNWGWRKDRKFAGKSSWLKNISEERKKELLEDWRDIEQFPNEHELLKKYPEAGTVGSLKSAIRVLGEKRKRTDLKSEQKELSQLETRIDERISELIHSKGALINPGADAMLEQLREEFKDMLDQSSFKLTKQIFNEKAEKLAWTEGKDGTLTVLRNLHYHRVPKEKHSTYLPNLTDTMIRRKSKELTGLVSSKHSATFIRGIGRLAIEEAEDFDIPKYTHDKPLVIELPEGKKEWHMHVPNATLVGIPYHPLIEYNHIRLALRYADQTKADAVTLTNVIDVDVKKAAGPAKVLRALFTSRNINPNRFSTSYAEKAERIMNEKSNDQVVYETTNEMFEDLLGGWVKAFHEPDKDDPDKIGPPEYKGPVFQILGFIEELLAATAAYWAVAYNHRLEQDRLRAEHKIAVSAVAEAQAALNEAFDELNEARATGDDEYIADCEARTQEFNNRVEELDAHAEAVRDEVARTRITNTHAAEWQRFFKKALSYIVQRFQDSIGTKVISKGSTWFQIRDRKFEINIPGNMRVNTTDLDKRVDQFSKDTLLDKYYDMVLVCPPRSINFRGEARQADTRKGPGSGKIYQAPMCVDAKIIREYIGDVVNKDAHPLGKVVYNSEFAAGMVDISYIDGVLDASPIPFATLKHAKRRVTEKIHKSRKIADGYIWHEIDTDQHHGSKNRARFWIPELESYLGVGEAVFHLQRRAGYGRKKLPPVHMYSVPDDPTQGDHFPNSKKTHPHRISYAEIEEFWREKKEEYKRVRSDERKLEVLEQLQIVSLYQFEVRGVLWGTHQLEEMFTRHLRPYADMYSGILMRAQKAGLQVRGISKFEAAINPAILKDTRDPGIINEGSGNHFIKSTDYNYTESELHARALRGLLSTFPEWNGKDKELEKLIAAPLDTDMTNALGTFQVPGGYEWGLELRDSPPKMSGWRSPIKGAMKNEAHRGNYAGIFEGIFVIRVCGDKHFLSMGLTDTALHLMGPASTHTDAYGLKYGLPPNVYGVVFIGTPAGGPDAGPILIRPLLYDQIDYLLRRKEPFDWDAFLPNAV